MLALRPVCVCFQHTPCSSLRPIHLQLKLYKVRHAASRVLLPTVPCSAAYLLPVCCWLFRERRPELLAMPIDRPVVERPALVRPAAEPPGSRAATVLAWRAEAAN